MIVVKTLAAKTNEKQIEQLLYSWPNSIYAFGKLKAHSSPLPRDIENKLTIEEKVNRHFYLLILIFEGEYTVDLKEFLNELFSQQLIASFEILK